MKILVLNYEFPHLGGGAGHVTYQLLREFGGRPDLSFDVVTSSTGGARIEQFSGNTRVHFLDIGKKGDLHYQTIRDLLSYSRKALRYARSLARKEEYDLCHAFFGVPCGYIANRLGLPYIVSLQGSDVPFFNERFRVLDRLLLGRMSRRIWRRASWVVANSKGLRDLAHKTSPDRRIEIIPNGVDTHLFQPGEKSGEGLRVVCVARLIRRKRIDLLIRAIAELREEPVSLSLAGTGNEEDRLKALAREIGVEDKVRFAGYVEHGEIPAFFQAGDIFALPSVSEGMSIAILEAMASGLPILMNDTGGSSEILEDGANGFLLESGSVTDIVRRIREFLGNRELLRRQGAVSRKKAEDLSWTRIADQYADLYHEMRQGSGQA
jgi:glycosyltransferase involved in cell wall biosynthesis